MYEPLSAHESLLFQMEFLSPVQLVFLKPSTSAKTCLHYSVYLRVSQFDLDGILSTIYAVKSEPD